MASVHYLKGHNHRRAGPRPARSGSARIYPFPVKEAARVRLINTTQGQAHVARLYLRGDVPEDMAVAVGWPRDSGGNALRVAIIQFVRRHVPKTVKFDNQAVKAALSTYEGRSR